MIDVDFENIKQLSKKEKYLTVIKQAESLLYGETNLTANLCNLASLLKYSFDYYLWVGFYFLDKEKNNLVLGPFQGKVACTRIEVGKGVCGTSFYKKEAIIVDNVNEFPGHIFCDGDSKSEIVIPIYKDNEVIGVIDVDSNQYSAFDDVDKIYLTELSNLISKLL